jgi:hypothetical protein
MYSGHSVRVESLGSRGFKLTPLNHASSPQGGSTAVSGNDTIDRRRSQRFPFSAVAEAVETETQTRIPARVSDISMHGCYLDVINVFAPGQAVQLIIKHSNLTFETSAIVVYSLSGMGMGLAFRRLQPAMEPILKRWVAEMKGEAPLAEELKEAPQAVSFQYRGQRHILGRLIGLMLEKRLLTHEEGSELLDELLNDR